MKLETKNIFAASDWFDLKFFEEFIPLGISIKKQFNLHNLKVDDKRLSSRILHHWYKTGLITDNRPNGKGWKKFSFSELVWVHIIFKLRKLS